MANSQCRTAYVWMGREKYINFQNLLILAIKYFLLGNPYNVWSSTLSIVIFGLAAAIYLLRWQRHYIDFTPAYIDHVHYAGLYPLLAWGLHYVPFFIMGRYLLFYFN
jgi:dolichyl-phosphate-mannose--protein O-mannosyl transferase